MLSHSLIYDTCSLWFYSRAFGLSKPGTMSITWVRPGEIEKLVTCVQLGSGWIWRACDTHTLTNTRTPRQLSVRLWERRGVCEVWHSHSASLSLLLYSFSAVHNTHTHKTYTRAQSGAIAKTLFSEPVAYPRAISHIILPANTPLHTQTVSESPFSGELSVAVCREYHLRPRCLKKDTSPVAYACMSVCVYVSLKWGFAAPDTVISSSRMYFLSRWRCGGRWGWGGVGRPTIQAYQTSSATIWPVTQDARARPPHAPTYTHTHTRAHIHIQKRTDSRPVFFFFLIDRWLSQQIESWDQHPRGLFLTCTRNTT